jgi:hypothetical protein
MKHIKLFQIIALLLVLNFGFYACKKDEVADPTPIETPTPTPTPTPTTTPTPSNPTPTPSDANGVLVALKTISTINVPFVGNIKQEIGIPVAFFFNTPGTYLDGGSVSCNSNTLTKQTNNTYTFTPGTSAPTGVDYSSGVNWSVGGNTANNIPSFNYNPNMGFPELDSIAGGISTVTKANGVTIAATNTITNADSVIFSVYGPGGTAQKVKAASSSSHTFSAADLSGLGSGSGYIQIATYKIGNQTFNGKKMYFINEAVFTKTVTIN